MLNIKALVKLPAPYKAREVSSVTINLEAGKPDTPHWIQGYPSHITVIGKFIYEDLSRELARHAVTGAKIRLQMTDYPDIITRCKDIRIGYEINRAFYTPDNKQLNDILSKITFRHKNKIKNLKQVAQYLYQHGDLNNKLHRELLDIFNEKIKEYNDKYQVKLLSTFTEQKIFYKEVIREYIKAGVKPYQANGNINYKYPIFIPDQTVIPETISEMELEDCWDYTRYTEDDKKYIMEKAQFYGIELKTFGFNTKANVTTHGIPDVAWPLHTSHYKTFDYNAQWSTWQEPNTKAYKEADDYINFIMQLPDDDILKQYHQQEEEYHDLIGGYITYNNADDSESDEIIPVKHKNIDRDDNWFRSEENIPVYPCKTYKLN